MSRANQPLASSSIETNKKHVDHRLRLYSAAAVAAGVSMLAMTQPAESAVVVKHVKIPINPNHQVPIDIDGDGVNDFSFSQYGFVYHTFRASLFVTPLASGGMEPWASAPGYASALRWGAKIGPSAFFSSRRLTMEKENGNNYAPFQRCKVGAWGFNSTAAHYLGVKFLINGETHYGWVRVNVATDFFLSATIIAYGYETVPNTMIQAGSWKAADLAKENADALEVSKQSVGPSLGMLALGADGLRMWRPAQCGKCQ